MKKYLWLLACLINLGCHQPPSPAPPDAASKVAGVYNLTYEVAYLKEYTDQPGSLTLVRTDAQRVKPTFRLFNNPADSSISQGYWQLTEVSNDSISYGGWGYGGWIKKGQIDMSGYGDGGFFFRFVKRK